MKKTIIFLSVSLALLSLSSCKSIYGSYERPQVNAQGLVRDSASVTDTLVVTDTTSFGNLPWRSVFTDPQLQALIEKGLKNNTNLLNAALNVDMAEAQLKASKLAFLPSFNFSPQGTITSWDGGKATQTYSLPINASWNIDLFGKLRNAKEANKMLLLQSKDYQVSVQTSLIANIANMYYTLLMLDKEVKLVEENSLCLLLNEPGSVIPRGTLEEQSLPEKFSVGVPLKLLDNRADVHAAEMNLASCFYNVNQARSNFYPSLTISGSGAYTNSSGMGIVNPGKILLSAIGSLVQPIFQNGQLVAALRVAKDQYQQAYNTWQNTLLSAGNEVSNALVLYNTSDQKSKLEAHQVEVLKKNVEDTRALMGSSTSTYLEVITAQSSLLSVELSKVEDDFYKMQAVVNLYYALGGGTK